MKSAVQIIVMGVLVSAASAQDTFAQSAPTKVIVRVTAHDAKIIGSGVGGARITVVNVETGDTLATGVQEGSTGNTQSIMVRARERGVSVFDTDGAAGFLAELDIASPTLVEIVAEGPLGTPDGLQRASKTMWVIPGRDVLGDGIILELLGFTVVIASPTNDAPITPGTEFEIRANITMLCGCPTEPGGLWNADEIDVFAQLTVGGYPLSDVQLEYAGTTSAYTAHASVPRAGRLNIRVIAVDASKGNFGVAQASVDVGN